MGELCTPSSSPVSAARHPPQKGALHPRTRSRNKQCPAPGAKIPRTRSQKKCLFCPQPKQHPHNKVQRAYLVVIFLTCIRLAMLCIWTCKDWRTPVLMQFAVPAVPPQESCLPDLFAFSLALSACASDQWAFALEASVAKTINESLNDGA